MLNNPRGSALLPCLTLPQDRGRSDLIATGAQGLRIIYADGSIRLCATSGLWNVPLGYGNKGVAGAISDAALQASYLSVFRAENTYARDAADALVDVASRVHSYNRVCFSTSGGSANDLAIKIIRLYQLVQGNSERMNIVSLDNSYHGLSFGAFALTGQEMGQALYGVDRRQIRHVQTNDEGHLEQLFAADGGRIGGVIIEPVLGNGCQVVSKEFLAELFRLRERHGFLIVADEVATGFWRTGTAFASDLWEEPPDVMLLSKALTNGTMAASAILMSPFVSEPLENVVIAHGETQAGTPLVGAAILATLDEFTAMDVNSRIKVVAKKLDDVLVSLDSSQQSIDRLDGRGAMRAIHCVGANGAELNGMQVGQLVSAIREEGVVVYPGMSGIQVFPAYTYEPADFEYMAEKIRLGLNRFLAQDSQQCTGAAKGPV